MTGDELSRALLLERFGKPVKEWKPEHHRAPLAARLDLLREETAHLAAVKDVA